LSAKKVHKVDKRVGNTRIALRNIMAATDFSAHSVSALTHGAAIARRYRSKFYVAHVIPTDVYKSVPTEAMEEALKQTRACVQDAMANQLRLEFLQAVQNEPVIKEGQVAPELLKRANDYRVGRDGECVNDGCGLERVGNQCQRDIDQANAKGQRAEPLVLGIGLANEVTHACQENEDQTENNQIKQDAGHDVGCIPGGVIAQLDGPPRREMDRAAK
jgi:hypothetical protein